MVLELANICLRSIRDGIEQGRIHGAHLGLLPPYDPHNPQLSLRQRVLDWVLMNGTIYYPNCLAALSSVEFLDGMTSLSTLKTIRDDSRYLTRVTDTLRSTSKCGGTIGSRITNLQLVVVNYDERHNRCVARLIGECPNLLSFSRRTVCFGGYSYADSFCRLLKTPEFESCRKIIEGVSELSIQSNYFGSDDEFLTIHFTNLRSLRICGEIMQVKGEAWFELMESVKDTLVTVHVDKLSIGSVFEFLPFPMSRLQELTIVSCFGGVNDPRLSADILRQCSELRNLFISFTGDSSDEALSIVKSLPNVAVDVHLSLYDRILRPMLLKEPPRFRLVDLFKEKITYVRFAFVYWNIEYAVAFEHFVEDCPRLVGFEFLVSPRCRRVDLTSLFNNVSRARQLREVRLSGDIIFGNLFQNCIDLDSLRLEFNNDVCNNDLIQWAQHGGRLSEIEIERCNNVDQDGFVALLVASGSKLRKLYFKNFAYSIDRVQRCLEQYCPLAESVELLC